MKKEEAGKEDKPEQENLIDIVAKRFYQYGMQQWVAVIGSKRLSTTEDFAIFNKELGRLLKKFKSEQVLPTSKSVSGEGKEAVEFAEWVGNQAMFCGLSPDNVRRWHKLVGNSKSVTTQELYQLYLESKKGELNHSK